MHDPPCDLIRHPSARRYGAAAGRDREPGRPVGRLVADLVEGLLRAGRGRAAPARSFASGRKPAASPLSPIGVGRKSAAAASRQANGHGRGRAGSARRCGRAAGRAPTRRRSRRSAASRRRRAAARSSRRRSASGRARLALEIDDADVVSARPAPGRDGSRRGCGSSAARPAARPRREARADRVSRARDERRDRRPAPRPAAGRRRSRAERTASASPRRLAASSAATSAGGDRLGGEGGIVGRRSRRRGAARAVRWPSTRAEVERVGEGRGERPSAGSAAGALASSRSRYSASTIDVPAVALVRARRRRPRRAPSARRRGTYSIAPSRRRRVLKPADLGQEAADLDLGLHAALEPAVDLQRSPVADDRTRLLLCSTPTLLTGAVRDSRRSRSAGCR